ncbi:MFS transporter [Xenorhabdus sp. TH1]|uniref:MFS transporter n=1 Tax=Xenorhabdus sp. TH1 TaxID=3130166 RepID=UPI0030D15930
MTSKLNIPAIVATSSAFVLIQLDNSVMNVSIVMIARQLGASLLISQWVLTSYTLFFAACLIFLGTLSDRIGSTTAFVIGTCLFALASVACSLAPSIEALIAARCLQGIAAALLLPSALSLLNASCEGDESLQVKALGWWMAFGGAALAIGPLVGGALAQYASWRYAFVVNVPIGIAGVVLLFRARLPVMLTPNLKSIRIPIISPIALGLAIASGVLITTPGVSVPSEYRWVSGVVLTASISALFWHGRRNCMSISVIHQVSRRYIFGLALGFWINTCIYGLLVGISLYAQESLALTPLLSGVLLVPYAVFVSIANVIGGTMAAKYNTERILCGGLITASAGYIVLTCFPVNKAAIFLVGSSIIVSIGMGVVVTALTSYFMTSLAATDVGRGIGTLNASRQLGGAVGVGSVATIWSVGALSGLRLIMAIFAILLFASGVGFLLLSTKKNSNMPAE